MAPRIAISAGSAETLGISEWDDGFNVAVVSRNAERIDFCLFDAQGEREVERLTLPSRTGDVWSGFVAGLAPGARYGLRADGPYDPAAGHWFDPAKLLVDPYAGALDRPFALHADLSTPRRYAHDTAAYMPKAIVRMPDTKPPMPPLHAPRFIYEVNVRAFTKTHPAVPLSLRGTVAGLATPAVVEHLVAIGVDTVELMPVAAWIDERHLPPLGLSNAWGYNPVVFMAPDPRLAPNGLGEIRNTVAALHTAGIAVILDVVFNHTGESDSLGPTLSLRGLDNALYFRHAAGDPGRLVNDTGTGNTLATDRPEVIRLILDAMRHWVGATGIDGFRLDLATVLGRADDGFKANALIFAAIEADPILARVTMIAEPWDIGPGGYQLGRFPARWREWNDRYRDDVRRFWRGDADTLGVLATRIAGSADIFGDSGRKPSASVNFVAAHDGFTLADTVAYAVKHNIANGEANRDGSDGNFSWNNGVEGPSANADIVVARRRDVRALLATLLISRGTAMLTAGDEFGRTQEGNNNAYAQDNASTWVDWDNADGDLAAFAGTLAALRKAHPSLSADTFLTGQTRDASGIPDVAWLAPGGGTMRDDDWHGGRALGVALFSDGDRTAIWINGSVTVIDGWLPEARTGYRWMQAAASDDVLGVSALRIPPRSVVIFAEVTAG